MTIDPSVPANPPAAAHDAAPAAVLPNPLRDLHERVSAEFQPYDRLERDLDSTVGDGAAFWIDLPC